MVWWDYDRDDFMDLFVGTFLSGGTTNRLYHNSRDGTFTRVANAISTNRWSSDLCGDGVVADYDNDGDDDLFVANAFGGQNLYRNDGAGSFTRLINEQVGPALGDTQDTMGAVWVDYDRDGFLDLFRGNGHRSLQNAPPPPEPRQWHIHQDDPQRGGADRQRPSGRDARPLGGL